MRVWRCSRPHLMRILDRRTPRIPSQGVKLRDCLDTLLSHERCIWLWAICKLPIIFKRPCAFSKIVIAGVWLRRYGQLFWKNSFGWQTDRSTKSNLFFAKKIGKQTISTTTSSDSFITAQTIPPWESTLKSPPRPRPKWPRKSDEQSTPRLHVIGLRNNGRDWNNGIWRVFIVDNEATGWKIVRKKTTTTNPSVAINVDLQSTPCTCAPRNIL